jgi:hypothetical protein
MKVIKERCIRFSWSYIDGRNVIVIGRDPNGRYCPNLTAVLQRKKAAINQTIEVNSINSQIRRTEM